MLFPWAKSKDDRIFINYRRGDAGGFAGRLADSLAGYFGADRIFRDVTDINYGDDFERIIDERIGDSGAVIVLIGDKWLSITNERGDRRLDDPDDYVCREIAGALENGKTVVPVLIGDALMPRRDELPARLHGLTRRNALSVTDQRWDHDVARLAKVLAIDVAGSVAQRKLDLMRNAALAVLFSAGAYNTLAFSMAVRKWVLDGDMPRSAGLREAGYLPLESAVPFIAILLAGTIALMAAPVMEPSRRKHAWLAALFSYAGSLAAFVHYAVKNVEMASWCLIVNFVAATIVTIIMLTLVCLAGFRAK